MALALAIGAAGGVAFFLAGLPLPWMLGPLTFALIAAVSGAPIRGPARLRPALVTVIGVLLGAGFKPELLGRLGDWTLSLGLMALYLAVTAAVSLPWYTRFSGFDRKTAFFAGMPGGLVEMTALAREYGGDERRVILAHAARIVVVLAIIGLWFRVIEGRAVGSTTGGPPLTAMAWQDIAILTACGLAGAWMGLRLRLPAPTLLGPMILSGAVHLAGLTSSAPPPEVVILAQVIIGTTMGARFVGTRAREVAMALLQGLGAILIAMVLAFLFALVVARLIGEDVEQVVLAFAPGGLTEMSLVAIAIEADVAFVALHHILRIAIVVGCVPLLARWMARRG